MQVEELKSHQQDNPIVKENFKRKFKKWWLLSAVSVLIVTPITLALTLPHAPSKAQLPKINNKLFDYEPLQLNEFEELTTNYSQIKQPFIASVTQVLNLYLPKAEWEVLVTDIFMAQHTNPNEEVTNRIAKNLSSNLRLIGLIGANKELDIKDLALSLDWDRVGADSLKFNGQLSYKDSRGSLPVLGTISQSYYADTITVVDNETMPNLIKELANDGDLKKSIKWNDYGYFYALDVSGNQENGLWIGDQRIELKKFQDIALGWFLDALMKSNLLAYNATYNVEELHFYVNGWNPEKLINLNDPRGLLVDDKYVILSSDNQPLNNQGKASSIISSIEFGWDNLLSGERVQIDASGSYILSPVWKYYNE